MSSYVYGALTGAREAAAPGTSATTSPPGLQTYLDALAALVPAEVLALHAAILSFTTKTDKDQATGESVTTITEPGTLKAVFFALIALAVVFFVFGHKGHWDKLDFVRAAVPALAFVGWTMVQKSTAFDAVWAGAHDAPRYAIAVIGAVLLGLVAKTLADKADQQPTT